jgi:hypothetical protein
VPQSFFKASTISPMVAPFSTAAIVLGNRDQLFRERMVFGGIPLGAHAPDTRNLPLRGLRIEGMRLNVVHLLIVDEAVDGKAPAFPFCSN